MGFTGVVHHQHMSLCAAARRCPTHTPPQGTPVPVALANCIIAACGQLGDMPRAWETLEAMEGLGMSPTIDTYDVLAGGCHGHGQPGIVAKVCESGVVG